MTRIISVKPNESNADYHADTAHLSSSMIKAASRSLRLFESRYVGEYVASVPTASMAFGSLVHSMALEPTLFDSGFVVSPSNNWRLKDHKEWLKTLPADDAREIIKPVDFERAKRCVDSLNSHPYIAAALDAPGLVETSHRWIDNETGVACKFRPDKMTGAVVLDIKTTSNLDGFQMDASKYGYDIQEAHYTEGAMAFQSTDIVFLFAVVETDEPHRTRAFRYDSQAYGIGYEKRYRAIEAIKQAKKTGSFAELGENEVKTLTLPHWEIKKWETQTS